MTLQQPENTPMQEIRRILENEVYQIFIIKSEESLNYKEEKT